ncbi:MAG: hypothetical protein IT367_14350, partial [Candidatus Hydrogenedentes bacterium]|nr:hypothetical protein [Candidatus Hydrogenedentota bacterium]
PHFPEDVTMPTLVVWYEKGAVEGTKAREMSPEEQEQLRGGGYVGE